MSAINANLGYEFPDHKKGPVGSGVLAEELAVSGINRAVSAKADTTRKALLHELYSSGGARLLIESLSETELSELGVAISDAFRHAELPDQYPVGIQQQIANLLATVLTGQEISDTIKTISEDVLIQEARKAIAILQESLGTEALAQILRGSRQREGQVTPTKVVKPESNPSAKEHEAKKSDKLGLLFELLEDGKAWDVVCALAEDEFKQFGYFISEIYANIYLSPHMSKGRSERSAQMVETLVEDQNTHKLATKYRGTAQSIRISLGKAFSKIKIVVGEENLEELVAAAVKSFDGEVNSDSAREAAKQFMADFDIKDKDYQAPRGRSRTSHSSARHRSNPKGARGEDDDLVRLYLTDIGQHPLLEKEDEVALAKAMEAGLEAAEKLKADEDSALSPEERLELRRLVRSGRMAKHKFIKCNLRLVVSIAKKYQASGLPLLDLIQEGNLGLVHAVEMYDWRKGFKFSTYGTWWIRQSITRGIANTARTIRLPVHAHDALGRVMKARLRLEAEHNHEPTVAELAADLEIPEDKVAEIMAFTRDPLSLSEPLREDSDAELGDVVADRNGTDMDEVIRQMTIDGLIPEILNGLTERERAVLVLRFGIDRGEPRTLEELGEHFNVTRERIRQIEARAMSKIRHPSSGIASQAKGIV